MFDCAQDTAFPTASILSGFLPYIHYTSKRRIQQDSMYHSIVDPNITMKSTCQSVNYPGV